MPAISRRAPGCFSQDARQRLQQHRQALARLLPAHEEDQGIAAVVPGRPAGAGGAEEALVVTVGDDAVLTGEVARREGAGRLGHGDAPPDTAGPAAQHRAGQRVAPAPLLAEGVEGGHHGRPRAQQGGQGTPGDQRLVQVQQVEPAGARLPPGP